MTMNTTSAADATGHTESPASNSADRLREPGDQFPALPSPAQEQDNDPSPYKLTRTGTDGRLIQFPVQRLSNGNRNENAGISASRDSSASHSKLMANDAKLRITKSRSGGGESWTIKTVRGNPYFRVRGADSGYRVQLCWTDTKPREPYLCYLSAAEWRAAKKGSLNNFLTLIITKLEQRRSSEDATAEKINSLLSRVHSLQ